MTRSIEEAQEALAKDLMRRKGVSGVGIGAHNGEPCLKVYVSERGPKKEIPSRYAGHPVLVVGGGPFHAMSSESGEKR